jgi:ribosomal protein L37AE/L43A
MAICEECGEEFPDERKALGYKICLDCGEEFAKMEIEKRKKIGSDV